MNIYTLLPNKRSRAARKFFNLQTHALQDLLWAIATDQSTSLPTFPRQTPGKSPNRKFIGVRDIPLEKIVGTVNSRSDFDHKFRPVKRSLRDRWINIYLNFRKDDLTPIVVHKVGEIYYVEDGHHRVSVARALGRKFIEAKVWEYTLHKAQTRISQMECYAEGSSADAYAA